MNTVVAETKKPPCLFQRINLHIKEWKHSYEVFGLVAAIAISCCSAIISRDSLKLATEGLDIQQKEFKVRNRPYVVVKGVGWGGPSESSNGKQLRRPLVIAVRNISDIPANDVRVEFVPMVNENIIGPVGIIDSGALARDEVMSSHVFLEDVLCHLMTNAANRSVIKASITYSGILPESQGKHATNLEIHYLPDKDEFKVSRMRHD